MRKTLIDAGPLIALFRADDKDHDWAVHTFASLRKPLFTTEPVIAEVSHFLGNAGLSMRPLLGKIESGGFEISFQLCEHAGAIAALMDKYDGQMDLADATLVRLSELSDDCEVMTLDCKDFSVYRRHGRQVIPLLAPPK
ncbi:MAG TPA: PIN domain-containing protein [Verrucomicrobiae bacterium]|jgi:hypothetical protein